MELPGKKIAVLVENMYEDQELWYPAIRLREAGADVMLVGPRMETFHSKHGYPAEADAAADAVNAHDFDALIIPGGYSPDHMRRHPAMVNLVKEMADAGKVVAAICHGPWMLASADVVRGRHVTCFFSIKDDIIHAGGRYEDCKVVRDGNIITSRMPADLPDFCRTIIEAVSEQGIGAQKEVFAHA